MNGGYGVGCGGCGKQVDSFGIWGLGIRDQGQHKWFVYSLSGIYITLDPVEDTRTIYSSKVCPLKLCGCNWSNHQGLVPWETLQLSMICYYLSFISF